MEVGLGKEPQGRDWPVHGGDIPEGSQGRWPDGGLGHVEWVREAGGKEVATGRLWKSKRWHGRYSMVHKCTKKHLNTCS